MPRFPPISESGDYTASEVTYTFTNDVGASLQFSEAIAEIRALLTSGAASADIESKYKSLGLKGLADLPREGATYATFTGGSGHGSLTWIDDIMTKALESPNTWAPKFSARAEIIEKTLMDALAVQLILDDLENAIDTTDDRQEEMVHRPRGCQVPGNRQQAQHIHRVRAREQARPELRHHGQRRHQRQNERGDPHRAEGVQNQPLRLRHAG